MIELNPITQEELFTNIYLSFEGDNDLTERFTPIRRTFQQTVSYIYGEVVKTIEDPVYEGDVHLFQVTCQIGEKRPVIGYIVTIENAERPHMLLSFGVNIKYRTWPILQLWLQAIKDLLGEPYYTCLWNANTRAINFFKKNGFTIFDDKDKTFKYVVSNVELLKETKICQLMVESRS